MDNQEYVKSFLKFLETYTQNQFQFCYLSSFENCYKPMLDAKLPMLNYQLAAFERHLAAGQIGKDNQEGEL